MEYASKNNESTVRTDKRKRNHKGEIPFINNRSEFATQAKFIKAIQRVPDNISARVIQRDPIGTMGAEGGFHSTDDDRRTIDILPMPETLHVYKDGNRTRVGKGPKRDRYGRDQNPLLKHYMVVKNGTSYQLPVKHFFEPRQIEPRQIDRRDRRDRRDELWIPNPPGGKSGVRSHQPEGFGGNQDWPFPTPKSKINIKMSRNATLQHEYEEEAGRELTFDPRRVNSKFFDAGWAVGTMSVVSTDSPLDKAGYTPSSPENVETRGMAEMAGTITIKCANLVDEINTAPAQQVAEIERLEIEIGEKIKSRRNALLTKLEQPIPLDNPFAKKAGILSHLVTMIAEDLIQEKQHREMIEEIPPSHPEIAPSAEAAEDEATATDLMGPD